MYTYYSSKTGGSKHFFFYKKTSLFLRFLSIGIAGALIASLCIIPKQTETLALGGPQDESEQVSEDMALSADGFLQKSAIGYEKSNYKDITEPFAYTIKEGDTYDSIAEEFNIDTVTIFSNNPGINKSEAAVGTILTIPPVKGVIHTIKRGDTLEKIAELYGVDAESIRRQNNLSIDDTIIVGKELIIPGGTIEDQPTETQPVEESKPTLAPRPQKHHEEPETNYGNTKGTLIKPTDGVYTQYFHRGHYAVDIANRSMPPVYAAQGGVVIEVTYSGWNYGYGKHIVIDHGNGLHTLYGHLSQVRVKDGQTVSAGEQIGVMGTSGRSSGIHLHFEVIQDGYKRNPVAYF